MLRRMRAVRKVIVVGGLSAGLGAAALMAHRAARRSEETAPLGPEDVRGLDLRDAVAEAGAPAGAPAPVLQASVVPALFGDWPRQSQAAPPAQAAAGVSAFAAAASAAPRRSRAAGAPSLGLSDSRETLSMLAAQVQSALRFGGGGGSWAGSYGGARRGAAGAGGSRRSADESASPSLAERAPHSAGHGSARAEEGRFSTGGARRAEPGGRETREAWGHRPEREDFGERTDEDGSRRGAHAESARSGGGRERQSADEDSGGGDDGGGDDDAPAKQDEGGGKKKSRHGHGGHKRKKPAGQGGGQQSVQLTHHPIGKDATALQSDDKTRQIIIGGAERWADLYDMTQTDESGNYVLIANLPEGVERARFDSSKGALVIKLRHSDASGSEEWGLFDADGNELRGGPAKAGVAPGPAQPVKAPSALQQFEQTVQQWTPSAISGLFN